MLEPIIEGCGFRSEMVISVATIDSSEEYPNRKPWMRVVVFVYPRAKLEILAFVVFDAIRSALPSPLKSAPAVLTVYEQSPAPLTRVLGV
jgi:hypothetical protein